jgi:hypothetical protein
MSTLAANPKPEALPFDAAIVGLARGATRGAVEASPSWSKRVVEGR